MTTELIGSIRPIRVRNKPILWRTALQAALVVCYLYRGRCPRLLFGSALQAPERLWRTDDVTTILTGHDATHGTLLPGVLADTDDVTTYPHRTRGYTCHSAAWRAVP
ncbi:MAG: hypothetical protein KIG66_01690 [Bacteroidaceae bacterium]|nr:hypothetical protein [Bacteroidaceae bacterium]